MANFTFSRVRSLVLGVGTAMVAAGLVGLLPQPAQAAVQTQLYVSPTGGGTTCTAAAPCSVGGAQSLSRTLAPSMSGDIQINVLSGTYSLTAPLQFTSADSGRNGFKVRWQAAPGATPVFSGAQQVTGWTPSSTPGVWQASVGQVDTRQIYVNGNRAVRARGSFDPAGFTKTSTGYTTTDAASLASWKNPSSIEFGYHTAWTHARCPIASVSGNTITMAQPCWDNAHSSPYLQNDSIHFIENAFELLDTPGEWYLDKTGQVGAGAGTLYYKPKPGEAMTGPTAVQVTLPKLQQLMSVSGSGTSDRVHDLQFVGLTFADATWLTPSTAEGFAEVQANFRIAGTNGSNYIYSGYAQTPGAVDVSYATNVLLQGNTLTRLGGAGLDVHQSSNNITVLGNKIYDVSSNGIQIGGITDNDQRPANNADRVYNITVSDNYVHNVATEFQGGVGIWGGFVDTLKLNHNEVANVPYSGISLGWGWGYLDQGGLGDGTKAGPNSSATETTPTIAGNNQITGNYVHDYMRSGDDGGAVYTLGAQPNSVESGNYYSDATDLSTARGIYLDNGTTGYMVNNNVVGNTVSWLLVNEGANSLSNPAAKNNTITGNWSNTTNRNCCSSLNTYGPNTDTVSGQNWPAGAAAVIASSGLETSAVDSFGVTHNWKTELKGAPPVDLAPTATSVVASNVYQNNPAYGAAQATDNNGTTRWATDSSVTSATLTLTFPAPTAVNRTVLKEAMLYGARIETYTVDYWDGSQWVPTVNGLYPSVAQTDTFPTVTTTQLRLNITKSEPGPSVTGFEVYNDATAANIAKGKTVTASDVYLGNPKYSGASATDGDVTTRWATNDGVKSANVIVDFGANTPVSSTVMREFTFYGPRVSSYSVDYWNGSAWVNVFNRGSAPAPVQKDTFPTVTTSKLRLTVNTTAAYGPSLSEFEIYS